LVMTHEDAMLIVTAIHDIYKILYLICIGVFSLVVATVATWKFWS